MVRISDRIWNHVERTDEVWKCRFCDHVFAKGTAAQIVKCHLAGVGGPGTKFCSDVPGHVRMEARREINEGEKKRRIVMSTSPSNSSNVTVEVSPKNDGERMIEQETKLRSRDGGVVERESDQEMVEAEFPAVMVKNGDSVCEICRHVYERRTPATRMQWHLAEIGVSGDTICTSMPDDVKGAIPPKITVSKRERRKTVPGSSHTEDVPTMLIEDVALEDLHNEADHGVRDEKMVEVEDASVEDSREKEITGVPPGDLRQPAEKDHKQSEAERVAFRTQSNIDVLPDGFMWRKYGKKTVKNSPHPRNYYKCSAEGCHVKKKVERDKDDPRFVITTYEGVHTHQEWSAEGRHVKERVERDKDDPRFVITTFEGVHTHQEPS